MNVSFTAEIERINRGHGIVDIGGKDVDIGPCSRSDVGRTVKFVKAYGEIQYCIRPAYLHKFSNAGNGIISTQSGSLNIGPVSRDYLRDYVEVVPHGGKAYCITEDATDEAYPYTQYSRISNPLDAEWFPISSKYPSIEVEISEIRDDTGIAEFGEYSSLTVKFSVTSADSWLEKGDVVSVTPKLHTLSDFPDEMEASYNDLVSKNSSSGSAASQSSSQSDSESGSRSSKTANSNSSMGSESKSESRTEESNAETGTSGKQNSSSPEKETTSQSEPDMREAQPSLDRLRQKAEESAVEDASENVSKTTVEKTQYSRSTDIREYVKARADGVCEGCGEPAPFTSTTGEPYLHAHHIHELSSGGSDSPNTVIALCPNCHYRVHHGEDGEEFNEELQQKLESIEGE